MRRSVSGTTTTRNPRRGACTRPGALALVLSGTLGVAAPERAIAQTISTGGFVEARGDWYPQASAIDPTSGVGALHARVEVSARATPWLRVRAALDARLDSYDQVERTWALDWFDRARRRRALAVRELNATVGRGRLSLEAGKVFIRWGAVDLVNPTDRFAPHDYLAVVDDELLAVTAARLAYGGDRDRVEVVWAPRLTPSRIPLYGKRWTVIPEAARELGLLDLGAHLPLGPQTGARWTHVASGYEYAVSYYDGFHHVPIVDAAIVPTLVRPAALALTQRFPRLRSLGGHVAWPLRGFTLKSEAAAFWAPDGDADEYVLYVIQAERQQGELFLLAGYAGEVVSERRRAIAVAPDRGLARAMVGKASYTIDPRRRADLELAVRQTLDGLWVRGEYSEAIKSHWRVTLSGSLIRGTPDDFIGQFRENSHISVTWRYSF